MKLSLGLFLLFVLLPLAELTLLLKLAERTNWQTSLLVVIVTGLVGSSLARRQGISIVRRIQSELAAGRMPADSVFDAVLVLVAGVLLITPGLITDLTGVCLLIPPIRRLVKALLTRWFLARFKVTTRVADDVIDSYAVRRPTDEDDEQKLT